MHISFANFAVDPEQHIEAPHPGHLLCQDTYFVGTIKGVGKIYQQTVIDARSSHAFAKLYLSKVPITAVDVLNDRVLPFYEEHNVEIAHQGYRTQGRTPFQAFPEGLEQMRREEVKPEAA